MKNARSLLFAVLVSSWLPVWSYDYDDIVRLSQAEQRVFGHINTEQAIDERVRNIESNLFGSPQGGSENNRISRICQRLGIPCPAPTTEQPRGKAATSDPHSFNQSSHGHDRYWHNEPDALEQKFGHNKLFKYRSKLNLHSVKHLAERQHNQKQNTSAQGSHTVDNAASKINTSSLSSGQSTTTVNNNTSTSNRSNGQSTSTGINNTNTSNLSNGQSTSVGTNDTSSSNLSTGPSTSTGTNDTSSSTLSNGPSTNTGTNNTSSTNPSTGQTGPSVFAPPVQSNSQQNLIELAVCAMIAAFAIGGTSSYFMLKKRKNNGSATNLSSSSKKESSSSPNKLVLIGVAAVILVGAALGAFFLIPSADNELRAAQDCLVKGEYNASLKHIDKAIELNPKRNDLHTMREFILKTAASAPQSDTSTAKRPLTPEELKTQIGEAINQNDMSTIIELCNKGIELSKSDGYFFARRGGAELSLQLYKEALSDLDQAIKLGSSDSSVRLDRGAALFGLGEYSSALDNYNTLLSTEPQNLKALMGKGRSLQKLRKYSEALPVYEQCQKIDAQFYDATVQIAYCYFYLGQNPKVIEVLDGLLSKQAENFDALRLRSICYAAMGELNKAFKDADKCTDIEPSNYEVELLKASLQSRLGKHRDALSTAIYTNQIAEYTPGVQEALSTYAGNLLQAAKRQIQRNPGDPGAYDDAAYAEIYLKNYDQAIQLAQKSIALGGRKASLYDTLGEAYFEQHNYPAAHKSFCQGILLDSKNADCWFNRARAGTRLARNRDSVLDYKMYLSLTGKDASCVAYSNMASCQIALGELQAAKESLQICLNMAPHYVKAMSKMATIAAEEGNNQLAFDWLDKCLKEDPSFSDAVIRRASIYESMGEWDRAISMYSQAARQYPNNLDLLSSVAQSLAELSAKDQAETLMRQVVAKEPSSGERAIENAVVLITCHDYDAAYSEAQRGLKLDHSQLGQVLNVQSTALDLAGKASEAIKLIRNNINDPAVSQYEKALLQFMAGMMLGELNQNDEALREFKTAADLVLPTQSLYCDITAIGPWWIYTQMKQSSRAAQVIATDNPNKPKDQWPNSILRFLRGELPAQTLESLGQNKNTKTDSYAIMGLKAALDGNDAEAERCFRWIESKGDPFSNWYMPLHGVYLRMHGHPQH